MNIEKKCKYCHHWSTRDLFIENESELTFSSSCMIDGKVTLENFNCSKWKAVEKVKSKSVLI